MEALRNLAKELLESGQVQAVLGYAEGTFGTRRPCFVRKAEDVHKLVFDEACVQNLAGLVTKTEVKRLGKLAVVASKDVLRSLLQLMAEHQLTDGQILPIAMKEGEAPKPLPDAVSIEEHLAMVSSEIPAKDREIMERLSKMTVEERWAFWQSELSRCIKCYACRSSCPMCYCGRCTMDCNRPQWVPVASHQLGNLEYHMVRAMHLAGRCVQCGECGRACPVGIPVHLLTFQAEESVHEQFGQRAGASAKIDYALSTFKPDDKETFIR